MTVRDPQSVLLATDDPQAVWPAVKVRWCKHCQKANHSTEECWSTHAVPAWVDIHQHSQDGWHTFTSKALPGLLVASKDLEAARTDVAESVRILLKLDAS